jgi:hypothetical protein
MTRRSSAIVLGCLTLGVVAGCSSTAADSASPGQSTTTAGSVHSTPVPRTATPGSAAGAKGTGQSTSPESGSSSAPAKTHSRQKAQGKQKPEVTKDDRVTESPTTDGETAVTAASVLKRLPNPAGPCPAVGDGRDVRSDSMAAGPFDTARQQFAKSRPTSPEPTKVRLYWIPKSGKAVAGGLVLKVTKVSSGSKTNTVRDAVVSDAAGVSFYDSQVPIAGPGTWQIKATSGHDTGCFRVTFRR